MRSTTSRVRIMSLVMCAIAVLVGCGADDSAPSAASSPDRSSNAITCKLSFRRNLETSTFQTEELTVRSDQDERESKLGPFRVRLLYFDDGFEPSSLNVYVYSRQRRRLLTQDLFQLGDTLRNQFVGDHGFTGLRYVRYPDWRAELQYICEVDRPAS
ncbi:MAG: hypothetical protein M3285_02665 [Actinomycetota bacterium]|nr:hypothetical protein [Actinomycetota bacterium]